MSLSQNDVVDYIKNLKLSEVKGLVELLENELGVKAAAPMMMGAMPAQGGAAAAAPAAEKTEFDVVLTAYPDTAKINVIKVVRELTGLGLIVQPPQNLLALLQAPARDLISLLNNYAAKLEGGGDAAK